MSYEEIELRYRGDVQRLRLEPGDKLVVKIDVGLEPETRQRIQKFIEEWSGVPVLIIDARMAIDVLKVAST